MHAWNSHLDQSYGTSLTIGSHGNIIHATRHQWTVNVTHPPLPQAKTHTPVF